MNKTLRELAHLAGQRIGELRRAHALTPEKVAQRAALSLTTYRDAELGKLDVRLTVLLRIAWVLDVFPWHLLCVEGWEGFRDESVNRGLARQGWHFVSAGRFKTRG